MKFSVARPNPGKCSTENFTKISRQISRHFWQRKTEKNFTSALLQGSCSEIVLALFFQGFNPPPLSTKFAPKIHSQTCRHSDCPLQFRFLEPKTFSPDLLLTGETKMVFRDFQRFFGGFQRSFQRPSQRQFPLRGSQSCCS